MTDSDYDRVEIGMRGQSDPVVRALDIEADTAQMAADLALYAQVKSPFFVSIGDADLNTVFIKNDEIRFIEIPTTHLHQGYRQIGLHPDDH
ncbi:hypothetical protein [Salinisphaera orenii]|uniref:hypothetical protein n=1 Tax=Salinisphaera orenii TaxID=856731 RepID=UPI0013A5F466